MKSRGEREDLNGLRIVSIIQLLLINKTIGYHGAEASDHEAQKQWDIDTLTELFENKDLWEQLDSVIGDDKGEVIDENQNKN